jgi:general secretion pathway protein C
MSSRWIGFFVWALVAACIAFWALKIFAATHPVPAGALTPVPPVATAGPMVRLFGAAPTPDEDDDTPSPASDRYQLVGVIAPKAGTQGIAIVTVDNQPAKAWHVGATVDGDTTLIAVARRSAQFGPSGGPTAFTLELPPPAAAQTGTLPDATSPPTAPAGPANTLGRGIGGQANAAQMRAREGGFLGARPGLRMPPGGRPGPGGFQPQPGGPPNGVGVSQPPVQSPAPQQQDNSDDNSDE